MGQTQPRFRIRKHHANLNVPSKHAFGIIWVAAYLCLQLLQVSLARLPAVDDLALEEVKYDAAIVAQGQPVNKTCGV